MPAGKHKNPRIAFVPSTELLDALNELAAFTGKPKAHLVTEILETAAPILKDQVRHYRAIAAAPEKAQEVIEQYARQATSDIAQAVLDFSQGPGGKKRGRPPGRGAAKDG
jgi:predicted DNA-binding protein